MDNLVIIITFLVNNYLLNRDISTEEHYPTSEQLRLAL